MPLGLTAAVTATDAAIQKKIFESQMTTIIFFQWRTTWYHENG